MKSSKTYIRIFILIICSTMLFGCGKKDGYVSYGDVVYDTLKNNISNVIRDAKFYTKIIKEYDGAKYILSDIGFSKNALSVYNKEYFKTNNLLFIAFEAHSGFNQTVDELILKGNILTVRLNQEVPNISNALMRYRGILIEIPKGSVPESVKINIQINEI